MKTYLHRVTSVGYHYVLIFKIIAIVIIRTFFFIKIERIG